MFYVCVRILTVGFSSDAVVIIWYLCFVSKSVGLWKKT